MEQAYVPMHFLKNLIHLVADEEGLSIGYVLRETGIGQTKLEEKSALATFSQSTRVYERVAELSTLPGIGFRSPSATSFSDQGVLSAMMIMAPTVGEAFQKLSKFIDVVGGTVDYHLRLEGSNYHVITKDKDAYSPAAHILIAEENLAIWKFSCLPIDGLEAHLRELHLDYRQPFYWPMYATLFPNCEIKFNQKNVAAVLSAEVVDMPIQTSNPAALEEMENACEELLARIRPTYRNFVMDYLKTAPSSDWNVRNVVDALNTNYKSLARRLKAEGSTPKDLITEQKKTYAMAMIARGKCDAQIAADLGYSDTSSFARGFKNWTGLTPSRYRHEKNN